MHQGLGRANQRASFRRADKRGHGRITNSFPPTHMTMKKTKTARKENDKKARCDAGERLSLRWNSVQSTTIIATNMALVFNCALVVVFVMGAALAMPNGAPLDACKDMTPQHGRQAQSSVSPYATKVSKVS